MSHARGNGAGWEVSPGDGTDASDMRRFRPILGVLAAAVLAPCAHGATYYVRTSGNNSNSGTSPASAWRDVSYADGIAGAGDIVYVGAGTYIGTVAPTRDGTSSNPVRFIADTTGAQTGDAGTVTLRADSGHVIDITSDNYQSYDGFTIDGNSSRHAISVDSSTGVTLTNLNIIDGADGIEVRRSSPTTITDCTITGVSDEGIDISSSTVTIESCVISGWTSRNAGIEVDSGSATVSRSRLFNGGTGIRVNEGASATVLNCIIHDVTSDGINTGEEGRITVIGSTFYDIGRDGISFEGRTTINNNIFMNIGDDCMDRNDDEGSLSVSVNLCYSYGGSPSEGFNSTEIVQDPQFVDAANNDFQLLATSPAIDAGTSQSSYTSVDYTGATRPQLAGWDLGAYEYGATPLTPADIPYVEDFEDSPSLDAWDNKVMETLAPLTTYLGRLSVAEAGRERSTLHVNTTVGKDYTVLVDVYFIDSWDNEDFELLINGTEVYDVTYSAGSTSSPDIDDDLEMFQDLGYWLRPGSTWVYEAMYRHVRIDFTATQAVTEITFENNLSQGIADESMGIDNVRVVETVNVADYLPRFRGYSIQTGFNQTSSTDDQTASGLFWGDLDGDGDLDGIITGDSQPRRVLNNGAGAFSVTTLPVGMICQGALVDLDNDGDLDFWGITDGNTEALAENNGAAGFTNAGALGFANPSNSDGILAADVDADGWCDVVMFSDNGNWIAHSDGNSPIALTGTTAGSYGLNDSGDAGKGDFVSSADVNNDGFLDFFYHYNGGKLFLSNGDGTYTQNNHGISVYAHSEDKVGSAWGDYDNDGDMDLWVGDHRSGQPGTLWRNDRNWVTGSGSFTNVASAAGLTDTSQHRGCAWGDMDNDGDLDLYVVTDGTWANNLLYENQGDGTFVDVAVAEYAMAPGNGHDAVFVDYDNDGDLDIAVTQEDNVNTMLRNVTDDTNYLKVRVLGAGGGRTNKAAIGTRVELWNQSETVLLAVREVGVARGFGQEPLWVHFGVASPGSTYTLRLRFPGGGEVAHQVTPASVSTTIGATVIPQMFTVEEGQGIRAVRWQETAPF